MTPLLKFTCNRNDLLAMQMFASRDVSRSVLNGVHFEFSKDKTILISTDARTLATLKIDPVEFNGLSEFSTDVSLVKLLKPSKLPVDIEVFEKEVSFRLNSIKVVGERIEGKFPNWRQIVPNTKPCLGKYCFRPAFLNTFMRAGQLLRGDTPSIQMFPHEDENGKFSDISPYSVFIEQCPRFYGMLMPYRASELTVPEWVK